MAIEIVKRTVLTEKTKDRFYGKPFAWGTSDCARMVAFHARAFGWKTPKVGSYRSEASALKYLKELGFSNIAELVSSHGLKEIAPARVLIGDIVTFESTSETGALGIAIGNGNMLGFHDSVEGGAILSMASIEKAWSIWNG